MDELFAAMMKSKLFKDFSRSECKNVLLSEKPTVRSFVKGQLLIRTGDRVTQAGIIIEGEVTGISLDIDGHTNLLDDLERGSVLGLNIAATPTQISPLFFQCARACKAAYFNYSRLMSGADLPEALHTKIVHNVVTFLANENIRRIFKINLLCQKSLRLRLLAYLRFMARRKGPDGTFHIPFNRSQLADYLNVNRSALSKELRLMRDGGLITCSKNKFTLCNTAFDADAILDSAGNKTDLTASFFFDQLLL